MPVPSPIRIRTMNGSTPASGTIVFYLCTIAPSPTTIPWNAIDVPLAVDNSGEVLLGDTLQVDTNGTRTLVVTDVTSTTEILVSVNDGVHTDVSIPANTPLIVTNRHPDAYFTPTGSPIAGTLTSDSNGLFFAYIAPARCYYTVQIGGGSIQWFSTAPPADASEIQAYPHSVTWRNALDFPSIQAAIDSLNPNSGGTVFIPAGTYTPSSACKFEGISIPSAFTSIIGERGTLLYLPSDTTKDLILIQATAVTLKHLQLRGPDTSGAGYNGCGIRCAGLNSSGSPIHFSGMDFEDILIEKTASWSVELVTNGVAWQQWQHRFVRVSCSDAKSGGNVHIGPEGTGPVQITMQDCEFNGPAFGTYGNGVTKGAVHLDGCNGAVFDNCTFQPAVQSTAISINGGFNNRLTNCHFESHYVNGAPDWLITAGAHWNQNMVVENCSVNRRNDSGSPDTPLRLLITDHNPGTPVPTSDPLIRNWVIRDCQFWHSETTTHSDMDVQLSNTNDSIVISNVLVGNYNTNPPVTRELKVTAREGVTYLSSGDGFWKLRMPGVTASSISSPMDGTVIWDSAAVRLKVRENGIWKTPTNGITLLGSGSVDIKTPGSRTIYTTPPGVTTYITSAVVRNASGPGGSKYAITGLRSTLSASTEFSLAKLTSAGFIVVRGVDGGTDQQTPVGPNIDVKLTVITGPTGAASATIDIYGFTL